jgi:hypothetical protein
MKAYWGSTEPVLHSAIHLRGVELMHRGKYNIYFIVKLNRTYNCTFVTLLLQIKFVVIILIHLVSGK